MAPMFAASVPYWDVATTVKASPLNIGASVMLMPPTGFGVAAPIVTAPGRLMTGGDVGTTLPTIVSVCAGKVVCPPGSVLVGVR